MLRKDLVRNRSGNAPAPRRISHYAFVIRPEEGEEKANGQRFNALVLDGVKQSLDFGRVDRVKHLTALVEALVRFQPKLVRHERGLALGRQVIQLRTRLSSDDQHVPEAARRD